MTSEKLYQDLTETLQIARDTLYFMADKSSSRQDSNRSTGAGNRCERMLKSLHEQFGDDSVEVD
jgi:hypothetical protein